MTLAEIESACDAGHTPDFSRSPFEVPELSLRQTFHPLGFPTEVRTNSAEVLALFVGMWAGFEKNFDTEAIRVDVHVVESESTECPPAPNFRSMLPHLVGVADPSNYSIIDLASNHTQIVLSTAAVRHKLYLNHFFLHASPLSHIATRFTTAVHAGCVALDGRGILLCGDSGAGKSSLSYACARAGWTYIADDASYALNADSGRLVTGDCRHVRLRPTAAALFPEINSLKMTPRASGKPSIVVSTAENPHIVRAQTVEAEFMVFLDRRPGKPQLVPYRKDAARQFMRRVVFGPPESQAVQYETIERLLTMEVLQLRYTGLDRAIAQLQTLLREGR